MERINNFSNKTYDSLLKSSKHKSIGLNELRRLVELKRQAANSTKTIPHS